VELVPTLFGSGSALPSDGEEGAWDGPALRSGAGLVNEDEGEEGDEGESGP
jgi:hypothetical protein